MTKQKITENRFEIDTLGFKTQMSEMPLWRLIQELISNSFDEISVNKIRCYISKSNENEITVMVIDDGNGFADYRDIFTLYKDSTKRVDPELRGRFNLGEKQFFAVAKTGMIKTGNYHIKFYDNVRETIENEPETKGVAITGVFESKEDEFSIITELRKIAVPQNKRLFINNILQESKISIKEFKAILPTPKASGKNQTLTQIKRECNIFLYKKLPEEKPLIYELGVPVQTIQQEISWHIDIRQKIPQTTSRDIISDKYLQNLYSVIAKNTLDLITEDNVGSNWISEALKKTDKETSEQLLEKIYGTSKVAVESKNHRSNEMAMENGYVLIKGSSLDKEVKDNLIKKNQTLVYASKEFETSYADSKPVEPNDDMIWFANIVKKIAIDVTRIKINVHYFYSPEASDMANYGSKEMGFNVAHLGKKFFKTFSEKAIGIVIHELAHAIDRENDTCGQYSHLKMSFIRNMEIISGRIGKKGISYWSGN